MARRTVPAWPRSEWLPLAVIAALALVALALWWVRSRPPPRAVAVSPPPVVAAAPPSRPPPVALPPLPAAELQTASVEKGGKLVATARPDRPTTIDAALQREIGLLLERAGIPYAAVAMIEPATGHVIALADRRDPVDPTGEVGSLTRPTVPAASVIKVVTAAALILNGATPDRQACFHGGLHGLDASHLRERPADRRCETLTLALARSSNAAFARFALRDLPVGALRHTALRFGFNRGVPSDVAFEASAFDDSGSDLDRARAAAGFAGSTLSPLHAAWIAAVVASDGAVPRIALWESGDATHAVPRAEPFDRATAAALRAMMVATTEVGTGRSAFARRPLQLRGMAIGGKTGSLSASDGERFRHVSWFIGFAPAERPRVAFAALAINGWRWKVKAPAIARDALGIYFDHAARKAAAAAPPAWM